MRNKNRYRIKGSMNLNRWKRNCLNLLITIKKGTKNINDYAYYKITSKHPHIVHAIGTSVLESEFDVRLFF